MHVRITAFLTDYKNDVNIQLVIVLTEISTVINIMPMYSVFAIQVCSLTFVKGGTIGPVAENTIK